MTNLATSRIEHDRFSRVFSSFSTDLGKERCKTVVVIHRPTVERMVVALCTLDSHPHEDLGDVFGHFERVRLTLEVVGCRVGKRSSLGRNQLPNHLIDGDIVGHPCLQPVVVKKHRLVRNLIG